MHHVAQRFRFLRYGSVTLLLLLLLVLLGGLLTLPSLAPPAHVQAQSSVATAPVAKPGFPVGLPGSIVGMSPIAMGDLNGDNVPDMVVGGRDGMVHAVTGSGQHLWSYDTGDMAIEGKAAIGDLDGNGTNEVVIGAGSTFTPQAHGGLYVFEHTGALRCTFAPWDFTSDGIRDGIFSSPALADLDQNDGGRLEIVFGGYDAHIYVLHDDCSRYWQHFVRDTVWSSPAIADMDRDGSPEVIIGVDTHLEPAFGTTNGGRLHIYRADGQSQLPGFPVQIDEVIYSSPAVGDIDGDGDLEVIVGTGTCWSNQPCVPPGYEVNPNAGRILNAWHHTGQSVAGWPIPLTHNAFGSPALVNLDADSQPEVVVNTEDGHVYAFNGNGSTVPVWQVVPYTPAGGGNTVSFPTMASPIAADLDADGKAEIVLPSNWELVVWNTRGQQISRQNFPPPPEAWVLDTQYSLNASAAVGDIDGDGLNELVAAGGLSGGTQGAIYAWDLATPTTPAAIPWPAFRRDAANNALLQESVLSASTEQIRLLRRPDSQGTIAVQLTDTAGSGLSWGAENTAAWLTLNSTSGVTPSTLTMGIDTTGLAPGTYQDTVTLVWGERVLPIEIEMTVSNDLTDLYLPLITR
jgi:hypothetical protein